MSEIKPARVIKNIITQPTYQCLLNTKKIAHPIELELSLLSRKWSLIRKKIIIASLKSENELSKIVSYLEQELQDPFKFGAKGRCKSLYRKI